MIKCKYCWSDIEETALKCFKCWEYQDIKYKWKWVQVKPWLFKKVFCTHCHYTGSPKTITKWSLFIEIILWCCFLIPWLIYSSHRAKTKYCVCPKCKSDRINEQ